jgi:hypothetical protein
VKRYLLALAATSDDQRHGDRSDPIKLRRVGGAWKIDQNFFEGADF